MGIEFQQAQASSTAIAIMLATTLAGTATEASANTVSINGGPPTETTGSISIVAPGSSVEVVVDTSDIDPGSVFVDSDTGETQTITINAGRTVNNPAGFGVWGISKTSAITATIDGSVTALGNAVTLDSRFAPDGGSVTLDGSGRIESTGLAGAWLLNDIGTTTLDGISGGISGVNFGVLVNTNGTYASSAGGDVNIGTTTRLGDVTSGGTGILVEQVANAAGDGDINIRVGDVTATSGFGIRTLGWTGATSISVSGTVESDASTGIYATSTTGNIDISGEGTGTVLGGLDGITADARFAPDGGDVTVRDFANVSGAGAGIWALADTGAVTIDNIGSVTGDGWGILVNTNGSAGGAAGGHVNIGMGTRLGSVSATGIGILVEQVVNAAGDGDINIRVGDVTATSGFGIRTLGWTGATSISVSGTVESDASTGIYATSTTGNIDISGEGTGTVLGGIDGIIADARFAPDGGDVTVRDFANVTGAGAGIWALADTGAVTIDNIGSVSGNGWGILVNTNSSAGGTAGGDVNIGMTTRLDEVTSDGVGILVEQIANAAGDGDINIRVGNVTAGTGFGIRTLGWTGSTSVSSTGSVTSTSATGIYATSTSGDIAISGEGSGTVTGGDEGITADATFGVDGGNIEVVDFASVTGADTGIWTLADSADTTISGIGTATGTAGDGILATAITGAISIQSAGASGGVTGGGRDGIHANAGSGDIAIGTLGAVGPVTGADDGLELRTSGGGAIAFIASEDVMGQGEWGVYSFAENGATTIEIVNESVITGNTRGLEAFASGSGDIAVRIGAGSIVIGQEFGMLTGTGTGVATVNNAGLITSSDAATDTGGDAYWAFAGATSLINSGVITGRLHSSGGGLSLSNLDNGVWNPGNGLNPFAAVADSVINFGTINVRAGETTFGGLETFRNETGGTINLQLGEAPTDTLIVQNFSPAGGAININFDVDVALGLGDAGTSGTADTIVVLGAATPTGISPVNIRAIGGRNAAGEPSALTGSVAVVYTGLTLDAPGPGDQLVASDNYVFGTGDPSTATRVFSLVEDGRGGAFLQWVPNITAATMGGFAGGDLQNAKGSAFGFARGGLTGALGTSASLADQSAFGAAGQCLGHGKRFTLWGQLHAGEQEYHGGGSGSNRSGALGWEGKIGDAGANECSNTAIGMFVHGSTADTQFGGGTSEIDGYGVGAYVRTVGTNGGYANLLGAAGKIESDLVNSVFRTTATSDALGLLADATAGLVKPLGKTSKFDLRVRASYLSTNTGRFADSLGFVVTDVDSQMLTFAGSAGVIVPIGKGRFFARGGANYTSLERTTNTYDVIVSGTTNEWAGTAEAGLQLPLSESTVLGVAGTGEFSGSATSYGGRIVLRSHF